MSRGAEVESEIARRLAGVLPPGSPNCITTFNLRQWVLDYLESYDQEFATFPDLAGQPHWNLWMMDVRQEDALFAIFVFRRTGVDFFCGIGEAHSIKRYAESDFPDDVELLPAEMARLFVVPEGSLQLSREDAEEWLGRGDWCGMKSRDEPGAAAGAAGT